MNRYAELGARVLLFDSTSPPENDSTSPSYKPHVPEVFWVGYMLVLNLGLMLD